MLMKQTKSISDKALTSSILAGCKLMKGEKKGMFYEERIWAPCMMKICNSQDSLFLELIIINFSLLKFNERNMNPQLHNTVGWHNN